MLIWAMCSSAAIAAIGLTIRALAAEGAQSVVAMIGRRFR
jgi:hypothetical protein